MSTFLTSYPPRKFLLSCLLFVSFARASTFSNIPSWLARGAGPFPPTSVYCPEFTRVTFSESHLTIPPPPQETYCHLHYEFLVWRREALFQDERTVSISVKSQLEIQGSRITNPALHYGYRYGKTKKGTSSSGWHNSLLLNSFVAWLVGWLAMLSPTSKLRDAFLWNVSKFLPDYMSCHSRTRKYLKANLSPYFIKPHIVKTYKWWEM
jgi:hypothetical protein